MPPMNWLYSMPQSSLPPCSIADPAHAPRPPLLSVSPFCPLIRRPAVWAAVLTNPLPPSSAGLLYRPFAFPRPACPDHFTAISDCLNDLFLFFFVDVFLFVRPLLHTFLNVLVLVMWELGSPKPYAILDTWQLFLWKDFCECECTSFMKYSYVVLQDWI